VHPREATPKVVRKNGIYFNSDEECGGLKFFLNNARESAGAGAQFNHDFGQVQADAFDHPFGQPARTGYNGAGARRRAEKHFQKLAVFVYHETDPLLETSPFASAFATRAM